jgi:hypothetical protein
MQTPVRAVLGSSLDRPMSFAVFSSPMKIQEYYSNYDRILPNPFQFISHPVITPNSLAADIVIT